MELEHYENYQLELIALELAGIRRWAAYLGIRRFDDDKQDFVCVMEKRRVSDIEFSSETEAIDEARRVGNALIAGGML